jgi:hypothetical protein
MSVAPEASARDVRPPISNGPFDRQANEMMSRQGENRSDFKLL